MRWVRGSVIVAVACCFSQPAWAAPERKGFTGDLGIGASLMFVSTDPETESRFGLAPLSVSLGGFLNPSFALLFRAAGTSFFEGGDQYSHSFYGPVGEFWLHDRFFLSGGVGVGVFGANPWFSDSDSEAEVGLSFDARAGAALVNGEHHDLTLSLELIPGFYSEGTVVGTAAVLAWKWY